ncbi:MAG: DUF5591 domain-containing protein [Thermoplasmata archaeon]
MIEFISRAALSRYALIDGYEIPNIIFTGDFKPDNSVPFDKNNGKVIIFSEEIDLPGIRELQEIELEDEVIIKEKIAILPGLSTLEKRPKELIKKILKTREEIGYRRILYAPNMARPMLLPVLHYLGIDILDDIKCQLGNCSPEELFTIEKYVKDSIRKKDLRVLVESMPDPLSKTLLRLSDTYFYSQIETFYPVTGNFLNASHFESLFRPDIQRWIKRITELYEKPEGERYALLLPCSATKPYSKSRSHRFYKSIIEKSGKHVHEVIVTSPLGVVPRELEFTFPAKNYDVPVTGYWFEDEKKMLIESLEKFISKNRYEKIIAYLPEDLSFLEKYLEKIGASYIIGNLHDENNIKKLLEELKKLDYIKISKNQLLLDSINSIAMFQFGEKFPLNGKNAKRRFDEIFVYEKNEQYLYFSPLNGNLLLYRESAKHLLNNGKHVIEIDDFIPKGSVFVAGIIEASQDIREGDEVVIHHKGKLIGTGTALMSFKDMLEQERGEAVRVRHTFIS